MDLAPVTIEDARTANARVPLITKGFVSARPFVYPGNLDNRARARDCMAAAMLYEAGDDGKGQLAVGQVVINRVRHPDRKSTRLNSSHYCASPMPSSA